VRETMGEGRSLMHSQEAESSSLGDRCPLVVTYCGLGKIVLNVDSLCFIVISRPT
jgi:hypothetical protein